MTTILIELHGTNDTIGNVDEYEVDDDYLNSHEYQGVEDHPIFDTPLVVDLLENHDDENEPLVIPLPRFIEMEMFVLFLNHLLRYKLESNEVGFGRHSESTYRAMDAFHRDYIAWARRQDNPSVGMQDLLDWVQSIDTVRAAWANSGRSILRIAKYFLVNLCSECGITSTDIVDVQYHPCHRAQWPNIPSIPVYEEIVNGLDVDNNEGRLHAWREAWGAAERDAQSNGRAFCTNDDLRCDECCRTSSCSICNSWECAQCEERRDTEQDNEDLNVMKRWHQGDPRAYNDAYMFQRMGEVIDDEDGRRGEPPQQVLNLQRCLRCRIRICDPCGKECSECHRRACSRCIRADDNLNSLCGDCMELFDNENEEDRSEIAILRRKAGNEYICRPCFDRQEHTCPCGAPSYDPNAESENSEAEFDEAEFDEDGFDDDGDFDDDDDFYNDRAFFEDGDSYSDESDE